MDGPLEYIAFSFEGNQFNGEIVPALREIVENEIVRIIDLAFVSKDRDGHVTIRELQELDPALLVVFNPLVSESSGLFLPSDLETLGGMLENNSSAALLLFEHRWATTFAQAVLNANGRVVGREPIPYEVVQEALNETAVSLSTAD